MNLVCYRIKSNPAIPVHEASDLPTDVRWRFYKIDEFNTRC